MCPLLVPASKGKLLLFFSFSVAAAIDSTTEANKAPLSSLYSLDVYEFKAEKTLFMSSWHISQLQKDVSICTEQNFYIY